MSQKSDAILKLLESCTDDEKRAVAEYLKAHMPRHSLERRWNVDAEVILTAVERAPDLTQRGVRGIIAEAFFANAMAKNPPAGWKPADIVGNPAYDSLLVGKAGEVRIQVKLQRRVNGKPMMAKKAYPNHYVVEVQKTRGGTDKLTGESTRPYRFGEFDIIAVNLHPSTGRWQDFMYTVGAWLIPREKDKKLIEILQPVSPVRNSDWTDDLDECIRWFLSRKRKTVCRNLLRPGLAKKTKAGTP